MGQAALQVRRRGGCCDGRCLGVGWLQLCERQGPAEPCAHTHTAFKLNVLKELHPPCRVLSIW